MNYFLGIDNGGTKTKAAIYDEYGREIAICSADTQAICLKPGFVERSMNEMWETNCLVVRGALEKSGLDNSQIMGIAVCGHGKGLYMVDHQGKPVRNAILSADTRATDYVKAWKENGVEAKAYQRSLQHVMACQPVALLAWLKDHEKETISKIWRIFPCKDYIRFKLTNKVMAEISDMSGTGLLNLKDLAYDEELLRLFGISFAEEMLPELCEADQFCGTVTPDAANLTGLRAGTPVFGGMFDINACALAVGAVTPKELCMIAGTWSINEFVSESPVIDTKIQMNSVFCLNHQFLVEESSATSAGNNEWLLHKILQLKSGADQSPYQIANEAVESVPYDAPTPIFLPFVMASNVNPNAHGVFVGMTENMDWKYLVKSVYEGIVFSHRWHLERLLRCRTEPVDEIRLAGGVTRSRVWLQMFADILGYPIRSVESQETGTLGCAILAATASGCKASVENAIADMVHYLAPVYPDPGKRDYYEKRYGLYCNLLDYLDPIWTQFLLKSQPEIG